MSYKTKHFWALNPKNEPFQRYLQQQKSSTQRLAAQLFTDLSFAQEYKSIYFSALFLRFLANSASAITLAIATFLATRTLFGDWIACAISACIALLLELIKNRLWRATAKQILKYRYYSMLALATLAGLHAVSLLGSALGAWQLPQLLPYSAPNSPLFIDTDSLSRSYSSQLNTVNLQIQQLKDKTSSSTIRRTIKQLTAQKSQLLDSREKSLIHARQRNTELRETHKNTSVQLLQTQQAQRHTTQIACVGISVFFELLFILSSAFIAYFLFRLFIDNQEGKASVPANSKRSSTASTAPNPDGMRPVIKGFNTPEKLPYTRVCAHCDTPFVHSIHNQIYCSSTCRKAAYEQRKNKIKKSV